MTWTEKDDYINDYTKVPLSTLEISAPLSLCKNVKNTLFPSLGSLPRLCALVTKLCSSGCIWLSDRDCKPLHLWENGRWLQDQMHPGPSKLLLLWCSPSLSRLLSLTFFLQLPDMWVVVPVSNCYKIKNSNVNKTPCLVHSRSLKMFLLALLCKLCSSKLKC